jgi:transposase
MLFTSLPLHDILISSEEISMYIAKSGPKGYEQVVVREEVRIPGTKKKKTIVVRKVGKYADLLAEDPHFWEKLKEDVRMETLARKESDTPLTISLPVGSIETSEDVTASYHFGHAIIHRVWDMLCLDEFLLNNCTKRNRQALRDAVYYLVAHRCSAPDSILASASHQSHHAGITPLGLDVFYSVLDVLSEHKQSLVDHLCRVFGQKTNRSTDTACYDVTTYSFESTKWGELRLFGFSKEHKNNEVQVVMGLLIDNNGIPINYEIFPGNTMDQNTLQDSVKRLKELYGLQEITVVADRGMNAKDNLLFLHGGGYHFVISYTLKRSKAEFRHAVLSDETPWDLEKWDHETGELVYASKILQQTITAKVLLTEEEFAQVREQRKAERKRGRAPRYKSVDLAVNVHVTYSKKRADKDASDRRRVLERLIKKLESPSKLKSALRRGGNQYLQMDLDSQDFTLDERRIEEAARYDGYYAVVTDRLDMSTEEAMEIYRGQWKIEESFRVLKTDLRARPVFVWTDEHINGHFVLCYLSLCMIRYLQYLMVEQNWESILSAEEIMQAVHQPLALVQGEYPKVAVTPTQVNQAYLDIAALIGLPKLKQNMSLTQFRVSTKLDLNVNLSRKI